MQVKVTLASHPKAVEKFGLFKNNQLKHINLRILYIYNVKRIEIYWQQTLDLNLLHTKNHTKPTCLAARVAGMRTKYMSFIAVSH